jgi:uncharacterized surface protein with fasciclin (FAS1) repeats
MKNFKNQIKTFIFLGAMTVLATSCKKEDEVVTPPPAAKDIVDIALADARFTTLTKLLTDNGLVSTLKGTGPFTVFAPTNDAFAKIDASKLSKEELVAVLKSHVVGAKVLAADVKSGPATTLGAVAYLTKAGANVYINGNSKVTTADVAGSNGVIHIIDNVILPPSQTLVKIAQGNPNFSELVSLVLAADKSVLDALSNASEAGYTVFAPTNAAFTELYKTLPKATLLLPATKKTLTEVLLYHVVPGRVFSSDLSNVTGEVATAFPTGKIGFDLTSGAKVKGKTSGASNITAVNILGTNGVIHVIDKVLQP